MQKNETDWSAKERIERWQQKQRRYNKKKKREKREGNPEAFHSFSLLHYFTSYSILTLSSAKISSNAVYGHETLRYISDGGREPLNSSQQHNISTQRFYCQQTAGKLSTFISRDDFLGETVLSKFSSTTQSLNKPYINEAYVFYLMTSQR